MGPSPLSAACLILAIRTAKWPANFSEHVSASNLEQEIEYAAHLAGRVLSKLRSSRADIFPSKKEPWYQANDNDEDVPK
jgi:hypothetical protein